MMKSINLDKEKDLSYTSFNGEEKVNSICEPQEFRDT